jgi:hypothetical protein
MKKLLLTLAIIALPLMGYGQIIKVDDESHLVVDSTTYNPKTKTFSFWSANQEYLVIKKEKTTFVVDTVGSSWKYYHGDRIILQDLIDYQEYCYNDSTVSWEYQFEEIDKGSGVGFTNYNKPKKRVVRHKIPTFNGFIEWMKNKEK